MVFCLKCGRETAAEQVFCDSCLQVMQQYPVKPGTVVHLPQRPEVKKPVSRKKILSSKEQLRLLRRANRRLRITIAVLCALLCIVGAMFGYSLYREYNESSLGKNYTIDTSLAP